MSHNREWDRGKYPSDDGHSWQYGIARRDEEYHGEGKRRKFNDGGSQGYEQVTEEGAHNTSYGQARQTDVAQEHFADDRFQKGSGYIKKRLVPSEPSLHVIFLGLDPDFTEADLQAYLTSNNCNVQTVTIIRDRSTGTCPFGFGFAQFTSVEHARAFVDPLFPFIQVPPPASHGASASAAFYKALEAGSPVPPGGRRVKIDYSQSANPAERRARGPPFANDGTRDIGNAQAPVLLFRGLDPLSGPQAIAQAMKNAAGPGKEGARGMRRIILIKDKVTTASWGFAFVEFVDVQSASAALGMIISPQIHPSGFRISDRPVAASFAHPYSFQPLADHLLRDDACLMSTSSLGGVEGTWVRYWDEASTAAILEFKIEEMVQPIPTQTAERDKKKKSKGQLSSTERPAEASALPVSDKPVTLSFKGGLANKQGLSSVSMAAGSVKKAAPVTVGFSMADDVPTAGGNDVEANADDESEQLFAAKRVAPLIASKKVVNNINKWNQVQEVLHDGNPPELVTQATSSTAPAAPIKAKSATPTPAESEFEFSDTHAMTCLLCARQFKSLDQMKRHNKESDLHKASMPSSCSMMPYYANLRELAREKANVLRAKAEQPKYRDRASERRIMHNQPDVPLPTEAAKTTGKRKYAEGPPKPPTPPPPPVSLGKDESNVGNKLLKMMGWKEGTGLGTGGEGRVDPIQTAIYAQGVGLGASKAKEIGKYAEGYSGYVHMAQDAARERYGS
ncbi:uncharacterized protein LAESUDRAFT_659918 [Laetiporus sulphureus 93-53]|uniref:G-patch domain-containing protein n=1 Tax=Laetiporus sulphureus 93-53 TaxID=1314785 RepID=A0A165CTE8_9APHY|nr:uncharacterized protein LAESUDRAFT_659918 [Laetiporus sulphureus 93-53]KZT03405.1 hypothetical protein LAESUDRAFT_659918 [Laetiporus sulphureus 93-53]